MERERPSASAREILHDGLAQLGLSDADAPRLEQLADLLARWAARLNLTAHRTAAVIAQRLILDAAALSQTFPDAPPVSLADLGSGAGFPGLPIAILWPGCQVTLVEARERRHHFQRTAIRTLEIRNAVALHGRAEALAAQPHAVVVAQAAAEPQVALSWMRLWVEPAGWMVIPQSSSPQSFAPPDGVIHVMTTSYQVPSGGPARTAWIGKLAGRQPRSPLPGLPKPPPL